MNHGFAIALDGPVASGKGTIARLLADRLPGFYLYTGAMYRTLALKCIQEGVDLNNESAVVNLLPKLKIDLINKKVLLDGEDVTERVRKEDAARGASIVAVYQKVRQDSVARQQQIAKREISNGNIVIAEGRDTGTRVFPNAALKIYLIADPLTRAKRRKKQENIQEDEQKVLQLVKERDQRDTERKVDPLVKEPEQYGYFIVDNSGQTVEETLNVILSELKNRNLLPK